MKKVILYGLNNFRLKIENVLADDYEIIGYSDFDSDIKTFEYKPYYKKEELNKVEFDYIIICNTNKKETEDIVRNLKTFGIGEEKIVQTYCLAWNERMFTTTFGDFIRMNKKFEGLVFGLSYSRFAFLTHFFDKDFFKFSLGGVDIFTNLKWITTLLDEHKELLSNVKYIVLDLPYYIFNWDLTKTSQIFYRMAYFDEFDDYRNFSASSTGQKYIKNYRLLKSMFAEKYENNLSSYSNNFMQPVQVTDKAENEDYYKASGIWYKKYEETIEENKKLFQEFVNKIRTITSNIAIINYPYAPKYNEINSEIIKNMRNEYYSILKSTDGLENVKHYDFLIDKKYNFDETCFRDATHFNGKGAQLFSKILNKKFNDNFYE